MEILIEYVLPILGTILILFSLASLFFPFGIIIRDRVQKFSGFGIEFEISLLTLFLVLGTGFLSIGIYINLQNDSGKVEQLQGQVQILEQKLEDSQKKHMTILLKVEGVTREETDNPSKWEFAYSIAGSPRLSKGILEKGIGKAQFSVTILDIAPSTTIQSLILKNLSTGKQWVKDELFVPLQPVYNLTPEQQ